MPKPRAIETERLISLHPDFAPVGQVRYATKEEADLLIRIGRARYDESSADKKQDEGYRHREMRASQSQSMNRKGNSK
jgi:hypothetical protein